MNEWAGLQIQVAELRQIFDRLMTHVESTQGGQVTLHEDYFYSLPAPGLYDVLEDAPDPTIGQLTESLDNLRRGDDTITYELVWLGDVLRAVGHLTL
jgi:hypothetical protein